MMLLKIIIKLHELLDSYLAKMEKKTFLQSFKSPYSYRNAIIGRRINTPKAFDVQHSTASLSSAFGLCSGRCYRRCVVNELAKLGENNIQRITG